MAALGLAEVGTPCRRKGIKRTLAAGMLDTLQTAIPNALLVLCSSCLLLMALLHEETEIFRRKLLPPLTTRFPGVTESVPIFSQSLLLPSWKNCRMTKSQSSYLAPEAGPSCPFRDFAPSLFPSYSIIFLSLPSEFFSLA